MIFVAQLTVVDAQRFTEDLKCGDALRDRSMEAFESDERTIAHLLVDQVHKRSMTYGYATAAAIS